MINFFNYLRPVLNNQGVFLAAKLGKSNSMKEWIDTINQLKPFVLTTKFAAERFAQVKNYGLDLFNSPGDTETAIINEDKKDAAPVVDAEKTETPVTEDKKDAAPVVDAEKTETPVPDTASDAVETVTESNVETQADESATDDTETKKAKKSKAKK